MTNWQPIATAPSDGTEVLTAYYHHPVLRTDNTLAVAGRWSRNVGSFHDGEWVCSFYDGFALNTPTLWQPLPEPPGEGPTE